MPCPRRNGHDSKGGESQGKARGKGGRSLGLRDSGVLVPKSMSASELPMGIYPPTFSFEIPLGSHGPAGCSEPSTIAPFP